MLFTTLFPRIPFQDLIATGLARPGEVGEAWRDWDIASCLTLPRSYSNRSRPGEVGEHHYPDRGKHSQPNPVLEGLGKLYSIKKMVNISGLDQLRALHLPGKLTNMTKHMSQLYTIPCANFANYWSILKSTSCCIVSTENGLNADWGK
jgi:hypothetical protein